MGAPKGRPKPEGAGRKKGTQNKVTRELREMILLALDESGGVGYLKNLAETNSTAFSSLLGKVLPTTLANDKDNPIGLTLVVHRLDGASKD